MHILPLGDRLIVKPAAPVEATKGGIVIPQAAQRRPMEGVVIAVGPDVVGVKTGQRVLYGGFAGNDVEIDEEWHILMREDEVMGIISQHTPGEVVEVATDAEGQQLNS